MPKKNLSLLIILIFLLTYNLLQLTTYNLSVKAQTPTPHTGTETCDLCGWCEKDVNPRPPNWDDCRSCIYNPDGTRKDGYHYTIIGCFSTNPEDFIQSLLTIAFSISGGVAFLGVLGGSAVVLTSRGDPQRLQGGKNLIISSIAGIFLIIFSVFLLRFVGFEILKIPGFE